MSRPNPDELEQLISRTLRQLPDRRAPRTLEHRVLAAIAARQALPWWKQSFVHWPLAARGAFLVFTGVLAAALIGLSLRSGVATETNSLFGGPLALWAQVRAIIDGIGSVGGMVLRHIPAYWFYGAAAFLAVMYATLIGVGATAYRVFLQQR